MLYLASKVNHGDGRLPAALCMFVSHGRRAGPCARNFWGIWPQGALLRSFETSIKMNTIWRACCMMKESKAQTKESKQSQAFIGPSKTIYNTTKSRRHLIRHPTDLLDLLHTALVPGLLLQLLNVRDQLRVLGGVDLGLGRQQREGQ